MRRFKIGDIVVTSTDEKTHKRIALIARFVTLEWWSGTGRETELVHPSHLTFIDRNPTDNFNYFLLMHKK